MKKLTITLLIISSFLISTRSRAQYAYDAFRYSEINQTGTARFQGIGGNHAALGGDASSISGNPAGLGFYNRSELSVSPGFTNISTDSKYIDRVTADGKSNGNIANASVVITSQPGFQRKWKRTSLGISFSRQQTFQNRFTYEGLNNRSAYVDKAVEDADNVDWTDKDYADELTANGGTYRYLDHAYYQLQMIYPTTFVSTTEGYARPYARDDRNNATLQRGTFDSKGAQSQWTISYGGNYNDKLYVGGSVGFNRIRYSYTHELLDNFTNATVFNSSTNAEELTVTGSGINATFGVIYRVSPIVQLGGSLTSPTFMAIRETFNQNVSADYITGSIRDDQGNDIGPKDRFIALAPNDFEYSMVSPFRGSAGATFFIKDKGFITGTIDYVGYSGMRLRTNSLSDQENDDFQVNGKAEVKDAFRNVVNARLGGEYRAGLFRGRLGIAYISDPNRIQDDGIDRSKLYYSAGAGIRTNRFFADISGTLASFKSSYTPYVLNNTQDYSSASISNKTVNVVLTVGTFF